MRLTSRRDDPDVIRARLRVLLAEGRRSGWLPDDESPRDPLDAGPHPVDDQPDLDDALPGALGRHRAPARTVRVDPGRRGSRALWVAGLLAGLAVAGWTWLDRPRVEPAPPAVTSAAAPASPSAEEAAGAQPTVVVSVVGLVARPGLVTLPEGARVADAVAAAGGLLPEADPASVNLAAVVADGQQIAVGVPGAVPADPATAPAQGGAPAGPLDLNAATAADLDALPGIGPVLAERIIAHREDHGRFTSVEQLDDVPGIGPAIYAELADLVRV
ncbi:competence protein ComEA [Geodermatophilus saharensis]|uniref:Competence protein ComEA n=1 Tax=Geodermatophilus saharensis TaxID=1137994 RepID=A0A239G5N2_9ACTN|nr:helix-hairpin-helix domain-containing protein [Geodermatophilus saharensis]SNS64295.1 competence protein ComEA [Geodermatophilus saharensis]